MFSMFHRKLLLASAIATVLSGQAWADDYVSANHEQVTIEQAASMMAYSAGNDQARVSIAPNWSDELGFSVRAAAGSYLGDAVALGAIVEHGQDKQEYLANLALRLSETLSLIGTVGQLAEHKQFVSGEGEDKATQMEYGLSLKGHLEEGLGFEANAYAANAKASNEDIETGKLYGTEALASIGLADTTLIKIGGGYEWLEWDGGDKNNRWTFRSQANQRLTDRLALQGHAKLGASERTYGGGLNLNLSTDGTNLLGLNYSHIEGRHGIADDKRVELSWTYGFGANVNAAAADITDTDGTIRPAADVATVAPANNLLGDVMKRPAYLPERVLARANSVPPPPDGPTCADFGTLALASPSYDIVAGTGDFSSYMIVTFYFVTSSPELSASIDQMFELEVTNNGGTPIYIYKQAFYNSTSQNFPINGFFLNTQPGFSGTVEVTLRPLGSSTLNSCTPEVFNVPVTYTGPA